MKKTKCLVICTKYPYPPSYGLKIAIYQLLNLLSDFCDIHVIVITDEKHGFEKFKAWAELKGLRYTVFVKSKPVMLFKAVGSLFSDIPLQVALYTYRNVEQYIINVVQSEKVDLVIPFLIRTAPYAIKVKRLFQTPVLMAMVDSISLNYRRLLKNSFANFLRKAIVGFELRRLEKFERFAVAYFDKTYLVNEEEKALYQASEKVFVMPNYVEEALFSYDKTCSDFKDFVVFFGKMDYQPNVDAVLWFLKYVFPYVGQNVKFGIIGPNVCKRVKREAKKFKERVKIFGFVDDPYIILRSSAAVIAPMKTGAGIQNKILEAMAVESLVVLSSIAATPIGGRNGVHYIVEDSPKSFAELINDIFKNPDKYSIVRKQARELIKEKFSKDSRKDILRKQLNGLFQSDQMKVRASDSNYLF